MNRYRQLTHAKSGDAGTGRGAAAAAKLDAAWQRESSLRAQARHMTGRKRALAREWGVAILLFYCFQVAELSNLTARQKSALEASAKFGREVENILVMIP